jgi:hypothetical protein
MLSTRRFGPGSMVKIGEELEMEQRTRNLGEA